MATTLLPITAIVSTKNEERALANCLDGLQEFDEVIVVDSVSTDATRTIARERGVQVVPFSWNGEYPKKKQWILNHVVTKHPWILWIDADERPQAALIAELTSLVSSSRIDRIAAADIELEYHFAGQRLKHGHRVVKRSLVHRNRVRYPELDDLDVAGMGELEGHYQPTPRGETVRLSSRLIHADPDPVSSWVARHNGYSDWEAVLRTRPHVAHAARQHRSRGGQVFDRVPAKPLVFFLYSFVLKAGFLDGRAGFDYAVALSWYYWLIGNKVRELSS